MQHWAQYRCLYRVLFFTVLSLGMYLGMRPAPPPTPIVFNFVDSAYHAGGLFVCTILSYMAFPQWRWWPRGLLIFSVGLAIECVQYFHPTRSADLYDIYANSLGVIAGLLVIFVFHCLPKRD